MTEFNQGPRVYTVSDLTAEIKGILEERLDFVWVEGEISNFRIPASGHYYMVIKDEKAQIRGVMFRPQIRYLKFTPEDGMKVIVQGRINVYAPRGEYQIVLDYIEPVGTGALAMAFEQVKRKLAGMGVFDREKKRPLPFLPRKVAVITSPTGAAIRDFLKIIHRRFANMEIIIVPVRVQGEHASGEMVKALKLVNRDLEVDVIVLTRGGGSLEDLWAFNQEELALAIRNSRVPVVSAVGHEIDITISDLAADLRAPTPSAAAEILVKEKEALLRQVEEVRTRMGRTMSLKLKALAEDLKGLGTRLRDPRKGLANLWIRLDEIHGRLTRSMAILIRERRRELGAQVRAIRLFSPVNRLASVRQALGFQRAALQKAMEKRLREAETRRALLEKGLSDLNPLTVLKRGYSITLKLPGKEVVKGAREVGQGAQVQVLLGEGDLVCRVEETNP